jgi:hypothetical protein
MGQSASLPIAVRQLTKAYGAVHALDHVDLDVKSGEFLTLLGPVGVGKDHAADGARRLRATGFRQRACSERRRSFAWRRISATWAWCSELCPLSAYGRGRQHRLSTQVARRRQPRYRPPRRESPRTWSSLAATASGTSISSRAASARGWRSPAPSFSSRASC